MGQGKTARLGKHIKAVLFDHDDTLVATVKAKVAEHRYIAKTHYGLEISDADVLRHYGKPFTELIQILYQTNDIDRAFAHNLESHENFPKILHDDTIDTIKYLRKKGLKIGMVTAANSVSLDYDMETLGIPKDLFDYIQTEGDTDYHKPDPRVFEPAIKWLSKHKIKPEEVVYIGDGFRDMEAALGAGLEFIDVTTGVVTQEEFKKNKAKSVTELKQLVD